MINLNGRFNWKLERILSWKREGRGDDFNKKWNLSSMIVSEVIHESELWITNELIYIRTSINSWTEF